MQGIDPRRPTQQDTFDLRDQITTQSSQTQMQAHAEAASSHYDVYGTEDEEGYSIMEHDSDGEERDEEGMFDEDDLSSELSIPDESINFDLVYSLHSFAATVEGQANVVKGDSLILMDDSNSYWWLVKVLKTQEVGYIPAENIETPFERLARLNKHRNVDLASATEQEKGEGSIDNLRLNAGSRSGYNQKTPSPEPNNPRSRSRSNLSKTRSVQFNASFPVHRYLPAVWNEDEEEDDDNMEWDDAAYIGEDPALADEEREREIAAMEALSASRSPDTSMEDAGQWNSDMTIEEMQAQARARQLQQQQQQMGVSLSAALLPGEATQSQQQKQQQQAQQRQHDVQQLLLQQQQEQAGEQHLLQHSSSRERMLMDPLEANETRKLSATPTVVRDDEGGKVVIVSSVTNGGAPYMQGVVMDKDRERQQQQDGVGTKRRAEEEVAVEEAKKRAKSGNVKESPARANSPASSSSSHSGGGGKLKKDSSKNKEKDKEKDRDADSEESGNSVGSKKKKGGVFRGLFGKKDKDKDKEKHKGVERGTSIGSVGSLVSHESAEKDSGSRISDDSSRSGHRNNGSGSGSGVVDISQQPQQKISSQVQMQSQQQQQFSTPDRPTVLSSHASQLRQRDMQQQALYQQYLNRSPSSPPEAQPSYGLQSAPALMSSSTFRPSPGSPAIHPSSSIGSTSSGPTPIASASTSASSQGGLGLGPPSAPRQRPGSLIIMPGMAGIDAQSGGVGVHDLSVIRVFAGRNLQTEATFKTVLLNSSTTAAELVKQAIQRFRLPETRDVEGDAGGSGGGGGGGGNGGTGISLYEYYLTVKRVEGGAYAVLRPHEKPLVVFEGLVMQAMQDEVSLLDAADNLPPKVKRSSVSSISSVASNLSMHPAIRKLPMNDFTDDSAVKFYLNRRANGERDSAGAASIGGLLASAGAGDKESSDGASLRYRLYSDDEDVEDHTLIAETSQEEVSFGGEGDVSMSSMASSLGQEIPSTFVIGKEARYLTVSTLAGSNVPPERFSSPSLRFALQLIIHPGDLPEDMVFHPHTEAIVPRETLSASSANAVANSPAPFRRKVFMFPKNVTVAEVIELGLERFGILEGVVDGGDEVEDKLSKRKNSSRVRYGLCVAGHGSGMCPALGGFPKSETYPFIVERELSPSSKVIDAYLRPPAYRSQMSNYKRRSMDSNYLLGNSDDLSADDPVFVLRRATSYRNSTTRHRMSAPLDEIALQHLHHQRDSTASSAGSDAGGDEVVSGNKSKTQPSRQEIIAAQRAATRANQRAILSAQTNSLRGMDVLLPNNAVLRSSRFDSSDRMRYSYVEPDGEIYDISDLVAEEWKEHGRQDVLAGVVGKDRSAVDSEKLDRVLNKIRTGKIREKQKEKKAVRAMAGHNAGGSVDMRSLMSMESGTTSLVAQSMSAADSLRSLSPSEYSVDTERSATPGSAGLQNRMHGHARSGSSSSHISEERTYGIGGRSRSATPTGNNPSAGTSGTATPTGKMSPTGSGAVPKRNLSIASVISQLSAGKNTPPFSTSPLPNPFARAQASSRQGQHQHQHHPSRSKSQSQTSRRPIIPRDDFGIENMMAVIECRAAIMTIQAQTAPQSEKQSYFTAPLQPLDLVDEIFFGRPLDPESLHPRIRDIYAGIFKQLEEMDKLLDEAIGI
ncbi:hypothetical protein AX15_003283 [Amanita polypyramis BW_CC]|nr:hypothetical protein AX15_003283 [Amanita polypyramis BW_CC]